MLYPMSIRHFGKGLRDNRVKKMYNCVPEWQKTVPTDPFDYKLRTKAEVMEEQKYFPPNFIVNVKYKKYPSDDQRFTKENLDIRESICKIQVDMREMKLAPL